jgi:molybdenum cofactor cytidylyltransferase
VKVGAVLLAAGGSSRFGQPKQLLSFGAETLVRRAVRAASACCSPVIVVVGREEKEIATELHDVAVQIVPNDDWEKGIGSSLRRGIEASPASEGVIVLTCDQPFVDETFIRELITTHQKTGQPIVASAYADTLGVPAFFLACLREELCALPDANGAKSIIASHPDQVATVNFPLGAIDIDSAADYENAKKIWRERLSYHRRRSA